MFKVADKTTGILILGGRMKLWAQICGGSDSYHTALDFYNLILVGLEC